MLTCNDHKGHIELIITSNHVNERLPTCSNFFVADGDSTPPDDSSGTAVLCGGVLLIMCMNIIFMGVVNYIYV